jgi:hypothetical protein
MEYREIDEESEYGDEDDEYEAEDEHLRDVSFGEGVGIA